ncbi:MAG TPA: DUF624 domain-containing protein [Bacilli bacterium]
MEMRGLMGGFYRLSEWIMRFSVINLLFLLCSLPSIFFLLLMWGAYSAGSAQANIDTARMSVLLAMAVAPFSTFPSAAAMFTVARKWVMNDLDVPLFKTFFKGFKENYKQSMLGGLFYVILFVVAYINIEFYKSMNSLASALSILFLVLIGYLAVSLFQFFSLMVHIQLTTWQLLKNALLVTIGRLFTSLAMAATAVAAIYVSVMFNFFPIVFFTWSVIAYVTFLLFYRMYTKMRERVEAEKAENSEIKGGQLDDAAGLTEHDGQG